MKEDASIYTGEKKTLGTVDYILFSLLFCASAAIGFYHAFRDRKEKNTEAFHVGGRKMHPIPVSMSLIATFMSALTLLGNPAEIYTNGTMFMWIMVAMLFATIGSAHIFIPFFYQLNTVSCFEYLQLRFGTSVRVLSSVSYILQMLFYMGCVLYAPSLAFQAVTGISLWGTMIGVATVCTLYTTLGGMKTVIWTDTLQLIVMFTGLVCIFVLGSKATDGFSNAWDIAEKNGRIIFFDFSFDPKTRHSVWTVAVGGGIFWTYLYGVNQAQVQRALSLPTLTKSQASLWLNFPGLLVIITTTCLIGVIMFAFYHGCHPVTYGLVSKNDQLLPLFVLDIMGEYHGLTGIFLACVFSGSLSSVSSGLNAISAIVLEDFVKPISPQLATGKKGKLLSRIMVVIVGCLEFAMAVGISQFGGLILQFSYAVFSILSGPILGAFVAGMVFPWTNQIGAVIGFLLSNGFMLWLGIGSLVAKPPSTEPNLPLYAHKCNWNATGMATPAPVTSLPALSTSSPIITTTEEPLLYNFYRMSYLWYTGLGMLICVFISLVVSILTGRTNPAELDSRLICPVFDRIFPCLPERIRKPLRFGMVYDKRPTIANGKPYFDNAVYIPDFDNETDSNNMTSGF